MMAFAVLSLSTLMGTAPLPKTISVQLLTKHHPTRLVVSGRGCRELNRNIAFSSLKVTVHKRRLKACPKRGACWTRARLKLRCKGHISVAGKGLGRRAYPGQLRMRVKKNEIDVLGKLKLEPYVAGVLQSELDHGPIAAREAQSVLIRSFALQAHKRHRHGEAALCDLTHCQAYAGSPKRPDPAALHTAGWVLRREDGQIAPSYYHSTCGGHTLSGREVWPAAHRELEGVSDLRSDGHAWCEDSPHSRWVTEVSRSQLAKALERLVKRPLDPQSLRIEVESENRYRIADARGETSTTGEILHLRLGRSLGWGRIKSGWMQFHFSDALVRIEGQGLGHRVGLCQFGAIARAEAGQSVETILKAYFPRYRLSK